MQALVTGGAGFIGSHIVERLLTEGHEVTCLDVFDPFYNPIIKRYNIRPFLSCEAFTLFEGDINDQHLLSRAIEGCEYVFHEAAQASVRVSVDNPQKSHTVNATGTLSLLQASVAAGVKKVINASSSSVYGRVRYLPFDEEHPPLPLSPYGVSKLAAEHYCRVFSELYGMETVSLRYFSVYGPRMRPDNAISIFTCRARANEPLEIYGDGSKTRDFTFVDDVVDATMSAITRGSGVYNIGGGNQTSIRDLAEAIITVNNSSSQILFSQPVKGDADHTLADTGKARRELRWRPRVSLKDGLLRYAEWLSNCQS